MNSLDIDIFCLQETHQSQSAYHVTDAGYLLVLSGADTDEEMETAGVGFLVAPHIRRSVIGFCQKSSRMANLKL